MFSPTNMQMFELKSPAANPSAHKLKPSGSVSKKKKAGRPSSNKNKSTKKQSGSFKVDPFQFQDIINE